MTGPIETRQQANQLPAVRATYDAAHASTRRGVMGERNYLMLFQACEAAGVDLGGPSSYDRQILAWLANWEPEVCAVVAGIIGRGAAGQGSAALTPQQREAIGQALADAVNYRDPQGFCPGCDEDPTGLCQEHSDDLDKTDAYLELAGQLGIEVER